MYRSDFSEQYSSTMRGWHDLYARDYSTDPYLDKIIDIDLAPDTPRQKYNTANEVRSDLENLAGDIPADEPDRDVLAQMIGANILHLRAVEGEKIDFETYGEGTIGIKPEPVPEAKIEAGAAVLDMLLKDEGLGYDASFREAFHERFTLTGQRAIRRAFRLAMKASEVALGRYVEVPDGGLEVIYVNKDVYWVGLLEGNRTDVGLAVNTHQRHPLSYGRIATIAAHEYGGHTTHLRLWDKAIKAGNLNPAAGITAAHTTYAVQAEALALNAEHILPADSPENILRALYNQQAQRVIHNMHYRINTGHSPRRVQQYGQKRLPLEPDENITIASIKAMRDDPLQRAYLAAYQPALELMAPVRSLSLEGRRAVLQKLYTGAFLPEQIGQIVSEAHRREVAELTTA